MYSKALGHRHNSAAYLPNSRNGYPAFRCGYRRLASLSAEGRPDTVPGVIKFFGVNVINSFIIPAKRANAFVKPIQFVISDQDCLAIRAWKRRHAIMLARHPKSIVHLFARPRNGTAYKSFRKIDEAVRSGIKSRGRITEAGDMLC